MANQKLIVRTPRGAVITAKTKSGTVRARLVWDKGFGQRKTKSMMSAQEFIDSEVLRRSDPYTPKRTGALIRSGVLGTRIGSGEVHQDMSRHTQDACITTRSTISTERRCAGRSGSSA